MVKIGNAIANELNKATGGKPGDQTGKEVRIQDWYNSNWTHVFRAKNKDVAEMIAKNCEKICINDNFGYGQDDRTTANALAVKVNYQLDKVNKPCKLDCSSMVALQINASGISISPSMYTGNEREKIMGTKMFIELIDSKYLDSSDYLMRGDILLKPGHTATVLSDGMFAHVQGPSVIMYGGTSNSIVDILNEFKIDSSKANRKKIAKANGIKTYIGTAAQNLKLCKLAKEGKLIIPEGSK